MADPFDQMPHFVQVLAESTVLAAMEKLVDRVGRPARPVGFNRLNQPRARSANRYREDSREPYRLDLVLVKLPNGSFASHPADLLAARPTKKPRESRRRTLRLFGSRFPSCAFKILAGHRRLTRQSSKPLALVSVSSAETGGLLKVR